MTITLRPHSKVALLVPTSMGVRLTPLHGQPFHTSSEFRLQVTSAPGEGTTVTLRVPLAAE